MIEEFLIQSNAISGYIDNESLEYSKQAWEIISSMEYCTRENILEAQSIITQNDLFPSQRKCLRRYDINIGKYKMLVAKHVQSAFDNWINDCNERIQQDLKDEYKTLHIRFEKIHPFVDGNGRIGRMLMNWFRIKTKQPIIVIQANEKDSYLEWFK